MFQETLEELFPSLEAVLRYREVVLFVAGLMKDSRPLVQFFYEMQVEHYLNRMRTPLGLPSMDSNLLESLQTESTVQLVDHPLHNKYINYYRSRFGDPDTTPIYCPSRIYHFPWMRHKVVLEDHLTESAEIPPCTMNIELPGEADTLLSTCSQIFRHQVVMDLRMKWVICSTFTAPRINPVSLNLEMCRFPDVFMEKLLCQLFGCGETLQKLWLSDMNLTPFESLLDELLEDPVAHHEKKLFLVTHA